MNSGPGKGFPLKTSDESWFKLTFNPVLYKIALVIACGKPIIERRTPRRMEIFPNWNHYIHRFQWVVVDFDKSERTDFKNHTPIELFTIQEKPGRILP